jgi:hypothetical protein
MHLLIKINWFYSTTKHQKEEENITKLGDSGSLPNWTSVKVQMINEIHSEMILWTHWGYKLRVIMAK